MPLPIGHGATGSPARASPDADCRCSPTGHERKELANLPPGVVLSELSHVDTFFLQLMKIPGNLEHRCAAKRLRDSAARQCRSISLCSEHQYQRQDL